MGTLSSGIGLISGLNTQELVDSLLAIDARPRDLLVQRISIIDARRSAFLDLSARITAIMTSLSSLKTESLFRSTQLTSSDPDVLTATSTEPVPPGEYSFSVLQLATTHQLISRGFSSATAPLASGAITVESALARVHADTRLEELNGFDGVRRGSFKITDGSGATATIDIRDAVTVQDVLDKINRAGIAVSATVQGDGFVLTEAQGRSLRIDEVDGGRTAADLGFAAGSNSSPSGTLNGAALIRLSDYTPLARLNDGLGLRRLKAGGDFSIATAAGQFTVDLSGLLTDTTRIGRLNHGNGANLGTIRVTTVDGQGNQVATDVDLSGAPDISEIKKRLNDALAGKGVVVTTSGGQLNLGYSDSTKAALLKIEDVSGSGARDLGIAASSETGKINGSQILFMDSVGDVLDAVNYAAGNDGSVTARYDGAGFVLHSASGGATLTALNGSMALTDLGFSEGALDAAGLTGRRVLAGINSVLLRTLHGGQGIAGGAIEITAGATQANIDLSSAQSLADVVQAINEAARTKGMNLEAGYDSTGTRLMIRSLDGTTPVTVADADAAGLATALGIAGSGAVLTGSNLQKQYVNGLTKLSDLNAGAGVGLGTFTLTNAAGVSATIDLTAGSYDTLQDVIDEINLAGAAIGVSARINDTGDGLLLEDTSGTGGSITVTDVSGSSARDLNLTRASKDGRIDGSYEYRFEVSGSDTLQSLIDRINAGNPLVRAALVNDGTSVFPYRLQLSSTHSGEAGELVVQDEGLGLDLATITQAQDAKVLVGDGAVLLTSDSNTISNAVGGLTLHLAGASEKPVTVTSAQDLEAILTPLRSLVSAVNSALGRIQELGSYDADAQTAGALLGDSAVRTAETRLIRAINQAIPGAPAGLNRLTYLGFGFSEGQLTLDEERFKEVYAQDPDAVAAFFSGEDGFAARLEETVTGITEENGLILSRDAALEKQRESLSLRVDQMNVLLVQKSDRYYRQFNAMEKALAALQAQQATLASLAALASQFGKSGG